MEHILLTSTHCQIRNLRESDCAAMLVYRSNHETCRYIGDPMSVSEISAQITRLKDGWSRKEGECLRLAAELLSTGTMIGEVLIRILHASYRQVEIGLMLHPHYQRQGLGPELTVLLLHYCFQTLSAHRVIGFIDVENTPSLRMTESIGFKREGLLRKNAYRHDEWRDEYLLAILDETWPQVKRRFHAMLVEPSRQPVYG